MKEVEKKQGDGQEIKNTKLKRAGINVAKYAASLADHLQKTLDIDPQETFGVMREALDQAADQAIKATFTPEHLQALKQFEQKCRDILLPIVEKAAAGIEGASVTTRMLPNKDAQHFQCTIVRPKERNINFIVDAADEKIVTLAAYLDDPDLAGRIDRMMPWVL